MVRNAFGRLPDGREAHLYTLRNGNGMLVETTDFGASVVSILVPDRDGKFDDVTFGYDSVDGYLKGSSFFGAMIGRFANRIDRGRFTLDGVRYHLPVNDGANTLHGGPAGFHTRLWTAEPMNAAEGESLKLSYVSEDGEQGFPGTVTANVVFTLTTDNALAIRLSATTDKLTVINMTFHGYFNLTGNPEMSILGEELMIDADHYTPVDSTQIPTGVIENVAGTPMDFRIPTPIGLRIDEAHEQLKICRGYDMNWVLNSQNNHVRKVAELYDPTSGRSMTVFTDEPGMQFYTGNFLTGSEKGKGGVAYGYRSALALETQHYPDSPNKPDFPSTSLLPGHTYRSTTIYKFSIR